MAQSRQKLSKTPLKGGGFLGGLVPFWLLGPTRTPKYTNLVFSLFFTHFPYVFLRFSSIIGRFRHAFLASPLLRGFCPTARWEKKREHSTLLLKVLWVPAAGRVQVFLVPAGWKKKASIPSPCSCKKTRAFHPILQGTLGPCSRQSIIFPRGAAVTRRRRLRIIDKIPRS